MSQITEQDVNKIKELFDAKEGIKNVSSLGIQGFFSANDTHRLNEVSQVVADYASEQLLNNQTQENLRETGHKLGLFLDIFNDDMIAMTLDRFMSNVEKEKTGFSRDDKDLRMKFSDMEVLGHAVIDNFSEKHANSKIASAISGFDRLEKNWVRKNAFPATSSDSIKENNIVNRVIEQVQYSYENNDLNAHAKLYAMDPAKITMNSTISGEMQKNIGRLVGKLTSDDLAKDSSDENMKQIGNKLGVFLSSMDDITIYMALYTVRKNILVNIPELTNVDENGSSINTDNLGLFVSALAKQVSPARQHAVISGITDYNDLDKKEENERQDKLINEKLQQLGVLPHELEKKLNALQKSYFEVNEISQKLGVEAPELTGARPKVNVEEFRKKLLGSNEDTNNNNNKPKQ